jgi:hypothetical protein
MSTDLDVLWLLSKFGDSGLLKPDCPSRAEGRNLENPGFSMEKRVTFLPPAEPSPGIHQNCPTARLILQNSERIILSYRSVAAGRRPAHMPESLAGSLFVTTLCCDSAFLAHPHTCGLHGGFSGVAWCSCQGYKACVIMAPCERCSRGRAPTACTTRASRLIRAGGLACPPLSAGHSRIGRRGRCPHAGVRTHDSTTYLHLTPCAVKHGSVTIHLLHGVFAPGSSFPCCLMLRIASASFNT